MSNGTQVERWEHLFYKEGKGRERKEGKMVEEVEGGKSGKRQASLLEVLMSYRVSEEFCLGRNVKQYNSSHFTKAVIFFSTLKLSRLRPSDAKRFAKVTDVFIKWSYDFNLGLCLSDCSIAVKRQHD